MAIARGFILVLLTFMDVRLSAVANALDRLTTGATGIGGGHALLSGPCQSDWALWG